LPLGCEEPERRARRCRDRAPELISSRLIRGEGNGSGACWRASMPSPSRPAAPSGMPMVRCCPG